MIHLLASSMVLVQATAFAGLPTVDAEPVERFGSATSAGGPTTVHVADLLSRADGSFYVVDPGKPAVEEWTSEGQVRRRIGQEGEGPGEYRVPAEVGLRDDTVWVRDGRSRFVLFSSDGEPEGLIRVPGNPAPTETGNRIESHFPIRGVALLSDGSVLAAPEISLNPITLGAARRIGYYRLSRAGEIRSTLLDGIRVDGGLNMSIYPSHPHMSFVTSNPFGAEDIVEVGPTGSVVVVVRRPPTAPRGETRSISVVGLGSTGEEVWARTFRLKKYANREASLEQVLKSVVDRHMEGEEDSRIKADRNAVSRAFRGALIEGLEYLPVSAAIVGSAGSILLKRTLPVPDGRQLWLLFSAQGKPKARVRIPAGVTVKDIRGSTIWGTRRGAFNVQYIVKLVLPQKL